MNDLKFALRQLLKDPGFTAVAVLTLALGIGANTAIFSFVNAILLRALPYHEPERLVMVFENNVADGRSRVGPCAPIVQEWRSQNSTFEELGVLRPFGAFTLTGRGEPEVLRGSAVSANAFPLLGVEPLLGRGFLPEEEVRNDVVLLSYELWQDRFGGDPGILGQSLTLQRMPRTVVGVMPPRTAGPDGERDLWIPLTFFPFELQERRSHNFMVFGRLKSEVTIHQARQDLALIAGRMAEANPEDRGWGAEVYPMHEVIVDSSRRLLLVLLGAVSLVLLIAAANIASLLLTRSAGRSREFAIRAALGAGRRVLLRQLLTESCLLAMIGGGLGLLLARLGLNALTRLSPADLPRIHEGVPLDGTTLLFAAGVSLTVGTLAGLAPALQASRPTLAQELAGTGRGSSQGHQRQFARAALVIAEVALSLTLLVGAGLTLRSFDRLLTQEVGYATENLVTIPFDLPPRKYPEQADRMRFYDALLEAARSIPGVDSAGYAFGVPLTGINNRRSAIVRDGPPPELGEVPTSGYLQVSPGYFATMKTPLVQGRDFTFQDTTNTQPVAIVDETFARNFRLGHRVLGRRLDLGDGTEGAEIIGVVKDIRRVGLAEAPRGEVYRPYRQICWGVLTLVVRTPREPADILRAVRAEVDRLDADIPLRNTATMAQLVSANLARPRISMQLLSGFAGVALLLAALGVYGVLANHVVQRTREIGIRMALGARRGEVIRQVIGQGMQLVLAGTLLGLCGALVLGRSLGALLYEIKPTDPATLLLAPLVLVAVAFLASYFPARRAARLDPNVALRSE